MIRPEKLSDRRVVMVDAIVPAHGISVITGQWVLRDSAGEEYLCNTPKLKYAGTQLQGSLAKLIGGGNGMWIIREL